METDAGNFWIFILIYFLFVLLRGIAVSCKYAVTEVNDSKVRATAERDKKYAQLLDIISNPSDMLVSFAVCRLIADTCSAFTIVIGFEKYLSDMAMSFFNIQSQYSLIVNIVYLVLLMGINAVIVTVFGEILPKRIAEKNVEKIALKSIITVKIMKIFAVPIKYTAYGISFVFSKILGLSTSGKKDVVTEEEILMMVEAGNETGVIEESQREMINNIFEFGDSVVSDVMTHRKDIVAVNINDQINEIVYLAINKGFSRIPVYQKNIDTIIGIICVKDLLCLVGCEHSKDFNIKDFMREIMYIPETSRCADVFENMTLKKMQMAVIVDEYGGTAGIVTMEDLLEKIVGSIQDEYDNDVKDLEKISENVFTIVGSADPEDILPELSLKLPEGHEYDTMSAFIVDLLGRIPENDEMPSVKFDNVEFTVLLAEDNWISKIKAVILPENAENK